MNILLHEIHKSNFDLLLLQAGIQRGSTLLKMGRLDEAHIELEKVLAKDPGNEEANRMYTLVEPLQRSIQEVIDFMSYKNYQPAIDRLTELVEVRLLISDYKA